MAGRLEKIAGSISEFNLCFIAFAAGLFAYCWFIFPDVWNVAHELGFMLPPVFLAVAKLFIAIRSHPAVYFLSCGIYYAFSLRFFKPKTNKFINIGLAVILVLTFVLNNALFWPRISNP